MWQGSRNNDGGDRKVWIVFYSFQMGSWQEDVWKRWSISLKDDSWSRNFWDGIESGFPVCCIIFYCDIWLGLRRRKMMFSYEESHDYDTGIGYVQCPECISGIKVKT